MALEFPVDQITTRYLQRSATARKIIPVLLFINYSTLVIYISLFAWTCLLKLETGYIAHMLRGTQW